MHGFTRAQTHIHILMSSPRWRRSSNYKRCSVGAHAHTHTHDRAPNGTCTGPEVSASDSSVAGCRLETGSAQRFRCTTAAPAARCDGKYADIHCKQQLSHLLGQLGFIDVDGAGGCWRVCAPVFRYSNGNICAAD